MNDLQISLNLCVAFLKEYKFLVDICIIDFFTDDHWETLPKTWQHCLSNIKPPDIAHLIQSHCLNLQYGAVLPLSLLAFKKCTSVLSVSRKLPKKLEQIIDKGKFIFQKHIGLKKRHEIQALSEVIGSLFKRENCTTVIDVGSGQGHLSRLLGLGFKLPVVALEHEEEYVKLARKFDIEAKCNIERDFDPLKDTSLPKHLQCTILPDIHHQEFLNLVSNNNLTPNTKNHPDHHSTQRCLLTGLHACGDLSATMIRLFKESEEIHALVSVACCYIKLTTDSGDPGKNFRSKVCVRNRICYPMSEHGKRINGHELSYKALKLACHGIEAFTKRLENNDPRLKIQCYRAVLEYILRKRNPSMIRPAVKTINRSHLLSFDEYARKAFERLKLKQPTDEELFNEDVDEMLNQWNKVIVMFSLAMMLGPVIESVILLDRMLYLAENDIRSELVAVFDPVLSPRCFALVASKPTTQSSGDT